MKDFSSNKKKPQKDKWVRKEDVKKTCQAEVSEVEFLLKKSAYILNRLLTGTV
jgi:transcriptional regulator of heat shock response